MKKLKCPQCNKIFYSSVTGWKCRDCEVELEEVKEETSEQRN